MKTLTQILEKFSDKELKIYRLRKLEKKTLDEVGQEFVVTRERIHQVEARIDEFVKLQ